MTEPSPDRPTTPARSRAAAVFCAAVLLLAGLGHRLLLARIDAAMGRTLPLKQPLSSVPMQLGGWTGQDEPLDEHVRRIAGDDESLNRVYVDEVGGRRVGLYVGYVGRPRTWMSHRPDVCYRTHGFAPLSKERMTLNTSARGPIPAVLYEFRSPQAGGPREWVLATYLFNGTYTNDDAVLTDANARTTGLFGGRAAYLARIQASLRATGDRAADVAILSDFLAQAIEPIAAAMPSRATTQPTSPGTDRSRSLRAGRADGRTAD